MTIETKPTLTAIHHVGVTVTDAEASAAWYERVLGFQRQFEERHFRSDAGGYTIVLGPPDSSFSMGVDHHPGNAGDNFDPTRTGLDHLSFQVASVDALHAWVAHLESQDVPNSGVYPMEGFPLSLVTFRDPDGVQLELIAFHA
ncbi:MAG TPA: VOC family protein [Pseudonocardia sp.]|jgi:glyoxylase I family protein|uniref:VOC family protein n=1 Tax=Pseudonocardia sp. TaxID=60912 RepID=UPI002ED7F5D3